MPKQVSLSSILIVIIIPACLSFLLFYNFNISNSHLIDEICEFGHLPLFGVLALIILWIMNYKKWPGTLNARYMFAGLFAVVFGIISEIIQILIPGRFFEVHDILYDALGASFFLVFTYPFPHYTSKTRKIIKTLCIAGILAGSYSILWCWQIRKSCGMTSRL